MVKFRGPRLKVIKRLGEIPELTTKKIKKSKIVKIKNKKRKNKSNKLSLFKEGLIEKQKLCFKYGITTKTLKNYLQKIKTKKDAKFLLIQKLESRLDFLLYKAGFCKTIPQAKQFINHGHVKVNDHKVSISSYLCTSNDIIKLNIHSIEKSFTWIKNFNENEIELYPLNVGLLVSYLNL